MIKLYMKQEWLLPVIPVLLLLIGRIWLPERTIDMHIHDTMYVTAIWQVFFLFLVLMLFYLVMHLYLRTRSWRNAAICKWHTWVTVICLLTCSVFLLWQRPAPGFQTITIEEWQGFHRSQQWVAGILMGVLLVFVFVQFLFLLYFIIAIIKNGLSPQRDR